MTCDGRSPSHTPTPAERLYAAIPQCDRRVEARFSSNFGWARLRRDGSGQMCDESDLELVAGEIGVESERTGSLGALRVSGFACALLGFLDDSAERLAQTVM